MKVRKEKVMKMKSWVKNEGASGQRLSEGG